MTKVYYIEVIGDHGNRFVQTHYTRLTDARKRAIREIGKSKVALLHAYNGANGQYIGIGQAEKVFFDDFVNDFAVQQYGGEGRRYRVSPKTGDLLRYNKEFKYL